jgi:hypothetical protein
MHEDRIGLGLGQNMLPVRSFGVAAEHAGEVTLIAAVITADAGEYMR